MSGIVIRSASVADVGRIVEFNQTMAVETEGRRLPAHLVEPGVQAVLDDPQKGFYTLAEIAGVLAGQLMVTLEWSDWRNGNFWWIQSVYVHSDYRRRGVYRALHDHVVASARADATSCGVRLYVDRDNAVAQSTYDAMGMSRARYDMFEIDFSEVAHA